MGQVSYGLGPVVQSVTKLLYTDLAQISTFQWYFILAVFDAQFWPDKLYKAFVVKNTFIYENENLVRLSILDLRFGYPVVLNNRVLGSNILQHSDILWMYWNTNRNNWEGMTFLGVNKNEEKLARLPD